MTSASSPRPIPPARSAVPPTGRRRNRASCPTTWCRSAAAIGFGANGAISNLAATPGGGYVRPRREVRAGEFDVIHVHEPLAPLVGWNAVLGAKTPVVGTFHAYSTKPFPNYIAGGASARGACSTASRRGSPSPRRRPGPGDALVRRRVHDHPQRRRHRGSARRPLDPVGGAADPLRRPARGAQGPAGPAHRLQRAGRARARPPHRDRRRARRTSSAGWPTPSCSARSTSAAASPARICGPSCTPPTCSARRRSRARASAWS